MRPFDANGGEEALGQNSCVSLGHSHLEVTSSIGLLGLGDRGWLFELFCDASLISTASKGIGHLNPKRHRGLSQSEARTCGGPRLPLSLV